MAAKLDRINGGRDPHGDAHEATIAIDAKLLAAVSAGAGLSVLPDFLVRDELAAGRLVQILPEWRLPSGGIYTVYPAACFRPPKVTRFVEMLVAVEQAKGPSGQGRVL